MHSSAFGTSAWMVRRSFSSAARWSSRTVSRYSSIVPGLVAMVVCLLIGFRQVFGELLERTGPTLLHSFMRGVKGLSLLFGRIDWNPLHRRSRFATAFGERERRKHFQRPRRAKRMTRNAAVFIRKGI